jgi:hypothetical protein
MLLWENSAVLSEVDECAEIFFDVLVDSFGLSIGLEVVGCGDVLPDSKVL